MGRASFKALEIGERFSPDRVGERYNIFIKIGPDTASRIDTNEIVQVGDRARVRTFENREFTDD